MRVDGVEMPTSAVAELALLLHRSGDHRLATRIGEAVDRLHDNVRLRTRDRDNVLRALELDTPEKLATLRAMLVGELVCRRQIALY